MSKRFLFHILLITCLLTACVDEEQNALPYVRVDFSVSISMYPDLTGGLPIKVQEGYDGYSRNGILIVPKAFGNDGYEAFDATCTRNIKEETRSLRLNKGDYTATCPKCGTVYNLFTGYAQNQSFHLQRYRAYGSNGRIYVTN